MKGTKTKSGQGTKTTTKTATATSSGARNAGTASKIYIDDIGLSNLLVFRQELKRSIPQEIANLHEVLRLQRWDQGCQRKGIYS